MRIVFVTTGGPVENAGIVRCLGLGSELAALGHTVEVLISGQEENRRLYGAVHAGVRFTYTPLDGKGERRAKLGRILEARPDVVHCMGADAPVFLPPLLARRLLRRPFTLAVDFEDRQAMLCPPGQRLLPRVMESAALRLADQVFCASAWLAGLYRGRTGRPVSHLPLGYTPQPPPVSPDLSLRGRGPEIGYLGTLIPPYRDQVEFLLSSLPGLRAACPGARLHVVGQGPERADLERWAAEAAGPGATVFHGYLPEERMFAVLGAMDALVLPFPATPLNLSRCPHKILLYARTGLPVVTNAVGEVPDLLAGDPATYYYLPGDGASFLAAVRDAVRDARRPDPAVRLPGRSWSNRAGDYLAALSGIRIVKATGAV